MKRVGIIGAENSHAVHIARIINVEKKVRGFRVTHIWGETREFAERAAEGGSIPEIVDDPADMLGKVDAVVVDHRHGKYHLPAALPFVEHRVPVFVDKPFCYRLREGKRFLARAEELGVPVCSFSVLPLQASFRKIAAKARGLGPICTIVTTGPCDIASPYGGVFFYGIHQVDMVLALAGWDVAAVQLNRGKKHSTATIFFRQGVVATMNLIHGLHPPFHVSVTGEKGRVDETVSYDEDPYLTGVRMFTRMFRSGKSPSTRLSMLTPVAVLEGLEKSLKERRRVVVRRMDA